MRPQEPEVFVDPLEEPFREPQKDQTPEAFGEFTGGALSVWPEDNKSTNLKALPNDKKARHFEIGILNLGFRIWGSSVGLRTLGF